MTTPEQPQRAPTDCASAQRGQPASKQIARLAAALLVTGTMAGQSPANAGEVRSDAASDGQVSLAGLDKNGNGVRDDVDRVIRDLKLKRGQVQALEAYAKSLQSSLAVGASSRSAPGDALRAAVDVSAAVSCFERASARAESVSLALRAVQLATVDTQARQRALAAFEDALAEGAHHAVAAPRPRCT